MPLADGRQLCLDCIHSVVVDSDDCKPLVTAVRSFFSALGLAVTQDFPVLCVETQALNAARDGERQVGGLEFVLRHLQQQL